MTPSNTLSTRPATGRRARNFARYFPAIARVLLGLLFLMPGLNGFFNFMPAPKDLPPALVVFNVALVNAGYMMPLISGTQLLCCLLLLSNRFVPLALALLAPLVVNIFFIHVFLAPSGLVIGSIVAALEVYLAWSYREAYRPMLAMRVPAGVHTA